jgi:hypothetical protein
MSHKREKSLTKKQVFWLEHLRRCEKGSEKTSDYARRNKLSLKSMYRWKARLKAMGALSEPVAHGDSQSKINPAAHKTRPGSAKFVAARILPDSCSGERGHGIRIHFPNGIVVERIGDCADMAGRNDADLLSHLATLS